MILAVIALAAATATPDPRASAFFDAEPVLKAWALRDHDHNRDGWLTMFEADEALRAFKALADSDGDGRITVREYRSAKAFLAARYGLKD